MAGQVTVSDAARSLGVSVSEARRLLDAGVLVGQQSSSGLWLIDADSISRRLDHKPRRGRPLGASTCWAVLLHLVGEAARVEDRKLRHLARQQLAHAPTVDEWPQWLAAHCTSARFGAHPSVLRRIGEHRRVTVAGDEVLSQLDVAERLVPSSSVTDVYLAAADAQPLVDELGLLADPAGAVILRMVSDDVDPRLWLSLPWSAAAVDGLSSSDPRVRSTSHTALTKALTRSQRELIG